jgi:hypothetical protein
MTFIFYTTRETQSWSLRKSSGQALDALSYVFRGEILFTLLPNVEAMIKNENWLIREAVRYLPFNLSFFFSFSFSFSFSFIEILSSVIQIFIHLNIQAVLSLGAVASGAFEDMLHYLPNLIPSLIQFLQDQHVHFFFAIRNYFMNSHTNEFDLFVCLKLVFDSYNNTLDSGAIWQNVYEEEPRSCERLRIFVIHKY